VIYIYKILLIEDDETISSIIVDKLNTWGYITYRVENFNEILTKLSQVSPQLVLLDINLPYYDGFYWCSKIREQSNVPIIFISSRDSIGDKIRAITQGGDDYVEKPFSIDLLIAKVQAILRRTYSYMDKSLNMLTYRDMIFNIENLIVIFGENEIELTPNEGKILGLLIRNQNKIVTRSRIMKTLWEDESFVDDNTLTVNINRLRRKLETLGLKDYIKTIKGEGYKLT
jgi:DNA-binding response OmpR family regulator